MKKANKKRFIWERNSMYLKNTEAESDNLQKRQVCCCKRLEFLEMMELETSMHHTKNIECNRVICKIELIYSVEKPIIYQKLLFLDVNFGIKDILTSSV